MAAKKEIEVVKVGFESGVTLSMANYESIRVTVSMEAVCSGSDRDETFAALTDIVREKLWEAVQAEKRLFMDERKAT